MLVLWLALLAGPAHASDQGDLSACFQSIFRDSTGPGFDLSRWSASQKPWIAMRDATKARDGLRFYAEDSVFYQAMPAEEMRFASHWFKFELQLSESDSIRCEFVSVEDLSDPGSLNCGFHNGEEGYKPITPKKLPSDSVTLRWPLKSAVLMRIQSLGGKFSREADKYRDRLEEYKKGQEAPPSAADMLKSAIGWTTGPPVKPDGEAYIQRLGPCLEIEDSDVREQARATSRLIRNLQP
jgi:hypothetical protein